MRLLALLALLVCAPASAQDLLVVLNKSDDTATVLDAATGEARATLPTGREPHEIAVSPDGRRALVTNFGTREAPGHTLTVLARDSTGIRVAGTLDLGRFTRPHGVAWLDDARAAVTAEGAGALVVVDVDAGAVTRAFATGHQLSHMVAVSPGGRAFVPDLAGGAVAVIDLGTGALEPEVASGAGAEGVGVSPDGATLWVTNRAEDTVAVFDVRTLERLATLPTGAFPIRVAFAPDGRLALVSNARDGSVSVFDVADPREVARIAIDAPLADGGERYFADQFEGSPIPIGIAVHGRRAFVAASNADAVVVLDLDTLRPVARWPTGRQPDGVAVW